MDGQSNIVCPVCTLYLRPGITLENHLTSHPKQKVIEALVKASQVDIQNDGRSENTEFRSTCPTNNTISPSIWSQPAVVNLNQNVNNVSQVLSNNSLMYQQFMSNSSPQPVIGVNPMTQQFVALPAATVFNPPVYCPQYMFQQQQQQQQQQQLQIVSNVQPFVPNAINITPVQSDNFIQGPKQLAITSVNMTQTDKQTTTVITENKSTSVEIVERREVNNETIYNSSEILPLKTISYNNPCSEAPSVFYKKCSTSLNNDNAYSSSEMPPMETVYIREHYNNNTPNISEYTDELPESPESSCSSVEEVAAEEVDSKPFIMMAETSEAEKDDDADASHSDWAVQNDDKACQTSQSTADVTEETRLIVKESDILSFEGPEVCIENSLTEDQAAGVEDAFVEEKDNGTEDQKIVCIPSSSGDDLVSRKIENEPTLEEEDMRFDFQNGQPIISKVDDYECMREANRDRPQELLNIGEEKCIVDVDEECKFSDKLEHESTSIDSLNLNIRADERMPPRGELSEQESNGASEVAWGSRMYQEGSSGMSTSYDLLARESWDASDCSDNEMPPLQSRVPFFTPETDPDDIIIPKKPPPPSYPCSSCNASFACPKERRVHQSKAHPSISAPEKKPIKKRQPRKEKVALLSVVPKLEPTDPDDITIPKTEEVEDIKENMLCNMCGLMLPSSKHLIAHNRLEHKIRTRPTSNTHTCKSCNETFVTEAKFNEHLRVHPLECNICGKNFYRVANLRLHLKRHMGIKPFKCDICNKGFLTNQKLKEHHNTHTGNAPIKCTMCDETFKRYSNLVQHRNRHHLNKKKAVKDFVCFCGEIYHSRSKLNWHKEVHDSKPKSCTYCYEKFVHMASLTRHIRRMHNQRYVPEIKRETENVECKVCSGVYLKSSLEAHMQTHSGQKDHVCSICGKEFTTKWNLKLHSWTHAARTNKPFKCELCQSAFIRHTDYISHMNSHRSVRPYTCNYCGCKFIRKYNCARHVREHEENKHFTCDICNKRFHRSYYLKEHMRVHSGVRPFTCHICGKTSATKSNHNKHMRIHHAREPVSTEG